ncbi:MAG: VWA domain-containing protein [Desulfobacterium sp.]|jgi:Ca-activated chloride channel family protein|nr:VWA domain-containing protein [Desulfobacterium sp.]
MFKFASPGFLTLLLFIPLVVLFRAERSRPAAVNSSDLTMLKPPPTTPFLILSRALPLVKYSALILLIIALARPQFGTRSMNVKTDGINIILALDLSGSMAALDFKLEGSIVNRLDAVKSVIKDFVMGRSNDRIGMVVFGSEAFTQLPLTRDYDTLAFVLSRLTIGAAGPQTAIGDAIGISLKRLEDVESKSNVVILLTDGKSNSGEITPEAASQIARARGVKIYTIGVGQKGKAPFLVNDPLFGERYVYQMVDMDYDALREISAMTGGEFFEARDTDSLKQIYRMIDSLEKTEVEVKAFAEYDDLYLWFAGTALALLSLLIVLSNTRLLRIP